MSCPHTSQPPPAVGSAGTAVIYRALNRRGVVTAAYAAALSPDHPIPDPVFETGACSAQAIVGPPGTQEETPQSLMRVAVHIMVPTHSIHGAAHGVAAIQKRGRALDDFQPFELSGVNEFAVVSRLRRQRPGPDAIFHDEHTVAVKPADDRPSCSRSETALRDPSPDPVVKHLTDGDIRGSRKFQRSHRFDTLKRFENGLALLASCDGDRVS